MELQFIIVFVEIDLERQSPCHIIFNIRKECPVTLVTQADTFNRLAVDREVCLTVLVIDT